MGAFDGYVGWGNSSNSECSFDKNDRYFSNQPSISFYKNFGITELRKLVADAERDSKDVVCCPSERKYQGTINLSTWYVKALIQEHYGE